MSNEKDFYCQILEEESEVDRIVRSWSKHHGFRTNDNSIPGTGKDNNENV